MKTSDAGVDAIKSHEGLRLDAYPDPGTGGVPWTIGYGHTLGVTPGLRITEERAEEMLREDLQWSEEAVDSHVRVPLNQAQFDALVSFVFNVGAGAFAKSTLLRKLNAGDYTGAAAEFVRWNKAGDRVLPGLTKRRAAEQALFLSGVAPTPLPAQQKPATANPGPSVAQPVEPAKPEERKGWRMAPFLIPAVVELAKLIPKLGGLFGGSEVAQRNVKAAEVVLDAVTGAVGATNAQEAVEKIAADPVAREAATRAVESVWWQISEAGGGGIDGARKASMAYLQPGAAGFWLNPSFWISLILISMPIMLLVDVLFVHPEAYVGELRTQIVTGILMVIGMVGGYWIGTSISSAKKDERAAP